MGGVVRTVCSVAEIESTAETACENCLGTELAQYTENGVSSDSYFAPVFLEGGGLESWRFDDQPTQGAPAEYPAKMIEILYPPGGFTHLCIKYNREGGARINVVAVNKETGERIRPKTLPANGLDKLCPILSATMDGAPLDPAIFQWSDAALTDLLNPVPGGWTTEPPSTPGDLALTARAQIDPDGKGMLLFKGWEHNRLSKWLVGTEHQWTSEGSTYSFDKNTYAGLIAYYEPVKLVVGKPDEPQYKPGPITPGYPEPLRLLLVGLQALIRYFGGILGAIFAPRRRVTAGDVTRLSPKLDAADRTRLETLARTSEAAQRELNAFVASKERGG